MCRLGTGVCLGAGFCCWGGRRTEFLWVSVRRLWAGMIRIRGLGLVFTTTRRSSAAGICWEKMEWPLG